MSDLISRSELLTSFNNKNVQITFDLPVEEVLGEDVDLDDFAMLVQDAVQAYRKMVIDTIKKQPTAYDIDKVIAKLEELDVKSITRYKNGNFGDFDGIEYYIKKREAIEIVKQGIVETDDVCEWKLTDIKKLMPYKTSCGNEDLYDNSYKYCPYCSKKIRLV